MCRRLTSEKISTHARCRISISRPCRSRPQYSDTYAPTSTPCASGSAPCHMQQVSRRWPPAMISAVYFSHDAAFAAYISPLNELVMVFQPLLPRVVATPAAFVAGFTQQRAGARHARGSAACRKRADICFRLPLFILYHGLSRRARPASLLVSAAGARLRWLSLDFGARRHRSIEPRAADMQELDAFLLHFTICLSFIFSRKAKYARSF